MAVKKEPAVPPKAAPKRAPETAQPARLSANAAANARAEVSPEELRELISQAAYYRAKQRGFAPGHELEDWIQAEAEVMRRLSRPQNAA